jgi:hypothetical protein
MNTHEILVESIKLDSIALQVIENGKRHTARLEAVESTV